MQAQIDRSDPGESELSLEIAASFELRQAKMAITGKYSKGKHSLAEPRGFTFHN